MQKLFENWRSYLDEVLAGYEEPDQWPDDVDPGQGVGPGLPVEAGAADQHIDESWPDSEEGLV